MGDVLKSFPVNVKDVKNKLEDRNPAVQLFGRRFFSDQPSLEILSELLLVMTSRKRIGMRPHFDGVFPELATLRDWPYDSNGLAYEPKAKLNLKLFAFLGSSRLETRHESHRSHGVELWRQLREKISTSDLEKDEALRILSNLFTGFWGNGAERTWCAQTFLPFSKSLLSTEVIWNQTEARRHDSSGSWDYVIDNINKFFSVNKHRFLARGGEVIYLHLCNALRQDPQMLQAWFAEHSAGDTTLADMLTPDEKDPATLHTALQSGFESFFAKTPPMLGQLADFIDTGVDPETARNSDRGEPDGSPRKAQCGWCPEESWREGYLLAVELKRILSANLDVFETVDLLEIACAMHVMRALAAQSYRATGNGATHGFDYRLLVSDAEGSSRRIKEFSRETLTNVRRRISEAIRIPEIFTSIDPHAIQKVYDEADSRYGGKLYLRIGKSLGMIIPRRGAGIRIILTDRILRYLLLSLVPGRRMTFDTFQHQAELHHGLVFEEGNLRAAREMQGRKELLDSSDHADSHLEQMLDASGVLVRLSDSCSLVRNPFYREAQA